MKRFHVFFAFLLLFELAFLAPKNEAEVISAQSTADLASLSSAVPFAYYSTAVSAGFMHTCLLDLYGGVKCWGNNDYGQLGNASTTSSTVPGGVHGLASGVSTIAAGYYHTCALTNSGGVKCWGSNHNGQLGNNATTSSLLPVDVSGLDSGVSAIAAGYAHTCALTSAGGVKCWGDNEYGQLGNDTSNDSLMPINVSGLTSGVSAIAAGYDHTCALTSEGELTCWGRNDYGQLGNNTITNSQVPVDVSGLDNNVSAIAAGAYHTCALTSGSGLKCWGDNYYGELGNNTNTNSRVPVGVSGLASNVIAITVGGMHTCALTTDGGIKCWGRNEFGELGNNTTVNSKFPVNVSDLAGSVSAIAAGYYHTCALTSTGGLKCWGRNSSGQLGNNTTSDSSVPVNILIASGSASAVTAGYGHTCALIIGDGIKCWGKNSDGQLGNNLTDNTVEPVNVSDLLSGVSAVTAGHHHTCALTNNGGMKCWGWNQYGQLGNNATTGSLLPVDVSGLNSGVSSMAAGFAHTCALTSAGGVKCWGKNLYGQLGNNTSNDSLVPVNVSSLTSGVSAITAGEEHTCALTNTGGVKCWGKNADGQLGNNKTIDSLVPVNVSALTSGVSAISAGKYHTCAVTSAGGVKCWGDNEYGQLGNNTTNDSLVPVNVNGLNSNVITIAAGSDHTCALTSGGGVKCWGFNVNGELGNGSTTNSLVPVDGTGLGSGVIAIAAGENHTCALISGGGVRCWGNNQYGQMGDGTNTNRSTYSQAIGVLSSVFPTIRLLTNPAAYGQVVQFSVNVAAAVGPPTGGVRFMVDGVNFGPTLSLVNGSATSASAKLPAGAHLIQVIYNGDYSFRYGWSAGVVQAVKESKKCYLPLITR